MSSTQLAWLKAELADAEMHNKNIGLFCHVNLHPECSNNDTLLWNYEEVLSIIGGSCVRAVFSGHQHEGGLFTDKAGVHHCCFESPLLCKPGDPGAFAVVEVHRDTIQIAGYAPSLTDYQECAARGHVLSGGSAADVKRRVLQSVPLTCPPCTPQIAG